ncbi:hypothetical protein KAJ83_09660 [Marivibrio halodurans]|uniref:Uncharacterized protein n=1 Tax=Marivibrio halodurans TaxID=2039722 RepID=A0A8J7S5R6_9PROT|nr:hypothetical protein [Marivibrio halodurans]MBP5857274.1 hypothetical protein [Marivibrio halodurans]
MTALRPPHGVNQLIEIVGDDAAIALVRAHGGGRLYVPASPRPKLVDLIGAAAAERLCRARGGEDIEIPLWRRGVYGYLRDRLGLSQAAAARTAGVTARTARNWDHGDTARLADKLQPSLFD